MWWETFLFRCSEITRVLLLNVLNLFSIFRDKSACLFVTQEWPVKQLLLFSTADRRILLKKKLLELKVWALYVKSWLDTQGSRSVIALAISSCAIIRSKFQFAQYFGSCNRTETTRLFSFSQSCSYQKQRTNTGQTNTGQTQDKH